MFFLRDPTLTRRRATGEAKRGANGGRSEATTVYYYSTITNNLLLVALLIAVSSAPRTCGSKIRAKFSSPSMICGKIRITSEI